MLIDTGEAEYADTVVGALKEYGVEQLDLVIAIPHASDHMGGRQRCWCCFQAKTFSDRACRQNLTPTSRVYENLLTALEQTGNRSDPGHSPGTAILWATE